MRWGVYQIIEDHREFWKNVAIHEPVQVGLFVPSLQKVVLVTDDYVLIAEYNMLHQSLSTTATAQVELSPVNQGIAPCVQA